MFLNMRLRSQHIFICSQSIAQIRLMPGAKVQKGPVLPPAHSSEFHKTDPRKRMTHIYIIHISMNQISGYALPSAQSQFLFWPWNLKGLAQSNKKVIFQSRWPKLVCVYQTSVPVLVGEQPHFGERSGWVHDGSHVRFQGWISHHFPVLKGQGACPLHLQSLQHWNVPDMAKSHACGCPGLGFNVCATSNISDKHPKLVSIMQKNVEC